MTNNTAIARYDSGPAFLIDIVMFSSFANVARPRMTLAPAKAVLRRPCATASPTLSKAKPHLRCLRTERAMADRQPEPTHWLV
ncbi:MAG: hypothetical protein ACT6SC_19035, partial [Blastomonas fulva]